MTTSNIPCGRFTMTPSAPGKPLPYTHGSHHVLSKVTARIEAALERLSAQPLRIGEQQAQHVFGAVVAPMILFHHRAQLHGHRGD